MSRRGVLAVFSAFAIISALPALSQPSSSSLGTWSGAPTMISGTSRYDRGEWIYTDFVYDDYGADTIPAGQSNVVSLAPTAGDFRYPNGTTAAGNAADIVEVRTKLAPNGTDLEVRVQLQSVVSRSVPAIRVERGGIAEVFTESNAVVDEVANTVTFTLSGAGVGSTVDLNLGAGLNDGQGGLRAGVPGLAAANPGAFTTGGPTSARLFDLAFNTRELEGRGGAWNEVAQSRALASGDLAGFTQQVNLDLLRAVSTTPVPSVSGYAVRVFKSRQDLGEGMASSFPQYRGRWQPYAIWVPGTYHPSNASPLYISMHSLSVHHNQYRGGSAAGASYATYYEQFGDGLGAVVVTPLGRGPDGWYRDAALVDTLEVWADALTHYNIDSERVLVGGYSMGGYGTYRLTTMMPDSFASAVSVVGPPGNGIWAYPLPAPGGDGSPDFTYPQLENTRHVPFWITHGAEDELVPVSGVIQQAERFKQLGHEYRFALHPAADHFAFAFRDEWSREVAWFKAHSHRVTDPQRVTFKFRPASWATGGNQIIVDHLTALTSQIGARLDGAYWIDNVVQVQGADITGVVDLSTGAIPFQQSGVIERSSLGVDGPSPYVMTGQDKAWSAHAAADVLSGHLSSVVSLEVDLGRAGLTDDVVVTVTSDTPATIKLVRGGVVVRQVSVG